MPNEVRDRRITKHFITDHLIVDEYLPALTPGAFKLYAVFCRIASTCDRVFPSYSLLESFLGCSRKTISKSIKELEIFELIEVERTSSVEKGNENNVYFILEPKKITEDRILKISQNLAKEGFNSQLYPTDWRPIFKPKKTPPLVSIGNQGVVSPGNQPLVPTGNHLVSQGNSTNKDLVVVTTKELTTTELRRPVQSLAVLFNQCLGKNVTIDIQMTKIVKVALKHYANLEDAVAYVEEKIKSAAIKKAKDPLGWLYKAVEENWKTFQDIHQESVEEQVQQKSNDYKLYWDELTVDEKVKRCLEAAVGHFILKHRRKPSAKEQQEITEILQTHGIYGPIDITKPIFMEGESWQG